MCVNVACQIHRIFQVNSLDGTTLWSKGWIRLLGERIVNKCSKHLAVFATSFFRLGLGGKWDLTLNTNECSCPTVENLPPLSPSFSAADTDHRRSPMSEACGFPSTRPSPRQPTAERLWIQQGDCCSWSKDPSVNYLWQRFCRSNMP